MVPVNYLAVLVAALANMVLGWLWYGPIFGKAWVSMMGFTPEKMEELKKKGMAAPYVIMLVGSIVMSFVLANALIFAETYLKVSGVTAGIQAGFWNWIGFIAPVTMGVVLWEGKPWKLWLLNVSYYLVGLVMMGVILALWV